MLTFDVVDFDYTSEEENDGYYTTIESLEPIVGNDERFCKLRLVINRLSSYILRKVFKNTNATREVLLGYMVVRTHTHLCEQQQRGNYRSLSNALYKACRDTVMTSGHAGWFEKKLAWLKIMVHVCNECNEIDISTGDYQE